MDPAVKYGGGDETIGKFLADLSNRVSAEESLESQIAEILTTMSSMDRLPKGVNESMKTLLERATTLRQQMLKDLRDVTERVEDLRAEK